VQFSGIAIALLLLIILTLAVALFSENISAKDADTKKGGSGIDDQPHHHMLMRFALGKLS
jgi:hypothetical protein